MPPEKREGSTEAVGAKTLEGRPHTQADDGEAVDAFLFSPGLVLPDELSRQGWQPHVTRQFLSPTAEAKLKQTAVLSCFV